MPRYDYRCPKCGLDEERNVPFEDIDNQVCDRCSLKQYSLTDTSEVVDEGWVLKVKMIRLSHYDSLQFQVPDTFKNKIPDSVLGIPEKGTDKWKDWQKRGIEQIKEKDFDIE